MVICVTYWWSPSKNEEVLKKYNSILDKASGLAKSVKIYVKYMRTGAQATAYFEIEEGKLEESLTSITSLYNEFVEEIESFTYEVDFPAILEDYLASRSAA